MTTEDRIRVTHREREAAAEELRTAYAVGCLDDDELEDRVSLAYAAKTRGDLTVLVCDLPAVPATDDAGYGPASRPAATEWPERARGALGLACWLMLAAAGAWVIGVAAGGALAVPLIFLWLAALRLRGQLLRWGRQLAATVLISRFSSVTNGPVSGKEVQGV
jgi:hypothetical protein